MVSGCPARVLFGSVVYVKFLGCAAGSSWPAEQSPEGTAPEGAAPLQAREHLDLALAPCRIACLKLEALPRLSVFGWVSAVKRGPAVVSHAAPRGPVCALAIVFTVL